MIRIQIVGRLFEITPPVCVSSNKVEYLCFPTLDVRGRRVEEKGRAKSGQVVVINI